MSEVGSIDRMVIKKLTEIVLANLEKENFGVKELALSAGMSRSSISRRLKSALKKTTSQFMRDVRLTKAMEMLQSGLATASEISYQVGFNSPAYFNTCFHQHFGYPPGEVKKRSIILNESDDDQPTDFARTDSNESLIEDLSFLTSVFNRRNLIEASTILIAFTCLTLLWYFLFFREATMLDLSKLKEGDKSIVVYPSKNLGDNPENRYFTEGFTEDIINNLFKIQNLRVVSRTTGDTYRENSISAPQIARKLGVNFILEVSVQQHDGMVRVFVKLIDAIHDRHIWSQKYDRKSADIFLIQSSIAKQIADELQTVLSSTEIERINKFPTRNPEAYNYYLKGRFHWARMTQEGLNKSISYLELAIASDPNYALAYSCLADVYYNLAWWGWLPFADGIFKAKEYAIKALEIDKNLAEAHAILGAVLCWNDWNWAEAEKQFTHAIELNPKSGISHLYYSEYLDMMVNNIEARTHINRTIELEPVSPTTFYLSALYFYHEGKFNESLDNFRKVEELNGDLCSVYWRYFDIYCWKNQDSNALQTIQKIIPLQRFLENDANNVLEQYNSNKINGLLKWLILAELSSPRRELLILAKFNARLGKKTEAIKWLNNALEMHLPGLPQINNDPDFEILRREPGFKQIVNRLGLSSPQYPEKTAKQNLKRHKGKQI